MTAEPTNGRSALLEQVRAVVADASAVYRGTRGEGVLGDILTRLDEPLRVAIAGKVKAGKSTLLNALVGDEVAPTDAGECTRIVTWYRHGITYRVILTPRGGAPRQVPFTHDAGAIDVSLGSLRAEDVENLTVQWPVPTLARMTLIDTPGIGSLSEETSRRSLTFLTPDDEQSTPSDAVVYLLRHLHAGDVGFLHAFHEEEYAQPSPLNCIGVLGRADEVSAGRLDAMDSAGRIAARYSADPRLRRLVQQVVPVAGLLAQAGESLRELEFRRLRLLADAPRDEAENLLLSADRFAYALSSVDLAPPERQLLLDRFGLYGVRLSVALLRERQAFSASGLAGLLVARSGIARLREVLLTRFADRRDTLKARSALLAVQRLLAAAPVPRSGEVAARLEQVRSGAHEFAELRLLNAVRRGELAIREQEAAEIERILGAEGTTVRARLGLPPDAPADEVRSVLFATLARWRQRAENPVWSLAVSAASRVILRTCEGMYRELDPPSRTS
jgi:hypothetical protein